MTQQPDPDLLRFVEAIRVAFGSIAAEVHPPAGGIKWSWPRRGMWRITAGEQLAPEPVIAGPAGEWRIARADFAGARFALLLLAAADALPDGVALPGENPAPPAAAGPVPIMLPLGGPRNGEMQPVIGPGGGPALVNLHTGCNFVAALDAGRMGVVVVKAMPELPAGAPVPATLYPAPAVAVLEGERFPSLREVVPGPPLPSPRPPARVPGANTGARPGPGFVRPAAPEQFAPSAGGWPYGQPLAEVDLLGGMGPGAAYAPEVIRDDRADPRCAPEMPMVVAGSDLPARGGYEPPAPAYDPAPEPAAAADPPAYDPGPAASCD